LAAAGAMAAFQMLVRLFDFVDDEAAVLMSASTVIVAIDVVPLRRARL